MNDMYLLVWASARATSVAVMWAHALRATAGEIFLLSTITNLCVVWPPCGSVKAVPLYESNEPARRVLSSRGDPGRRLVRSRRCGRYGAPPGDSISLCRCIAPPAVPL